MRLGLVAIVLALIATSGQPAAPLSAQSEGGGSSGRTDWPLHSLDLRNSRYSPLSEIDVSNVGSLSLKWSFQTPARDAMSSMLNRS